MQFDHSVVDFEVVFSWQKCVDCEFDPFLSTIPVFVVSVMDVFKPENVLLCTCMFGAMWVCNIFIKILPIILFRSDRY